MTISGAIAELQNLIFADDVPMHYKSGIQKVIETIVMEFSERPTECPVAIVFGCDECHRPKCDYKNCRRCKWFVTDKCHECFGNELFEDSGYVTQMNCERG